jgi:hypothetical protein
MHSPSSQEWFSLPQSAFVQHEVLGTHEVPHGLPPAGHCFLRLFLRVFFFDLCFFFLASISIEPALFRSAANPPPSRPKAARREACRHMEWVSLSK